ncbi:hypothetical protein [Aeromicrobium fastidiosum]|uniref:Uncharacterized protein n=1 Tax=Aeromicrobium fastidiosum TaxID=52699 RepID=A0A641APF4_9ACTN|nr:hypothetical protein [Aeromicrobium fastidiosum]KAA1378277.1 hypothetical protein ESP62_007840 [Aeromicrobium fastidiosum]MBP2388904.1 hypothetical protein [Aeromicrobium fastidiosum]
MRVYLGLDVDELVALARGEQVTPSEAFVAASTDEEDELAALEEAAEHGAVAAAAELDDPDGPVRLVDIASLHLDLDDSGDLAWFATQEIAAVIELVEGSG